MMSRDEATLLTIQGVTNGECSIASITVHKMMINLLNKIYMKPSQKRYQIQQAIEGRGYMGVPIWCTYLQLHSSHTIPYSI